MSKIAILLSGGLDSAILAGELLRAGHSVRPLYVRCGLCWEAEELAAIGRLLATEPFRTAAQQGRLGPQVTVEVPLAGLYAGHWSVTGDGTPDDQSPDAAVYLPGRNLALVTTAAIWCSLNGLHRLAMAPLAANPFPDATDEFFSLLARTLQVGLAHRIEILRPLAASSKRQAMELGREYRLDLTFSCIAPVDGMHCGRCNKCAERRAAFSSVGRGDKTPYFD